MQKLQFMQLYILMPYLVLSLVSGLQMKREDKIRIKQCSETKIIYMFPLPVQFFQKICLGPRFQRLGTLSIVMKSNLFITSWNFNSNLKNTSCQNSLLMLPVIVYFARDVI
jgi:hypothetical protein